MKYVYPAIIQRANDAEEIWYVHFPDVAGAFTYGKSLYEALEMGEDALGGILTAWEDFKAGTLTDKDGNKLPMKNRIVEPTPINEVVAEPDEFSTSAFVTLIKVDTDAHRKLVAELNKSDESVAAKSGAA